MPIKVVWFREVIAGGHQFMIEKIFDGPSVDVCFYHNSIKYYWPIPCPDKETMDEVFENITPQMCMDLYNENAANLN